MLRKSWSCGIQWYTDKSETILVSLKQPTRINHSHQHSHFTEGETEAQRDYNDSSVITGQSWYSNLDLQPWNSAFYITPCWFPTLSLWTSISSVPWGVVDVSSESIFTTLPNSMPSVFPSCSHPKTPHMFQRDGLQKIPWRATQVSLSTQH